MKYNIGEVVRLVNLPTAHPDEQVRIVGYAPEDGTYSVERNYNRVSRWGADPYVSVCRWWDWEFESLPSGCSWEDILVS